MFYCIDCHFVQTLRPVTGFLDYLLLDFFVFNPPRQHGSKRAREEAEENTRQSTFTTQETTIGMAYA